MATLAISRTAIAQETYNGSQLISSVSLPGATAETPGNSFACRFPAYFLNQFWTFQAQGIWNSSDGVTWSLISYSPPGLTATNSARVGFVTLTIQGTQYLCAGYNTSGTSWTLIKSTDGINWEESPSFNLSSSNIGRLTIYGNRGYCLNISGTTLDLRILDWGNDLIYETTVATSVGASTADFLLVSGSAVLEEGLYITAVKTTVPRGFMLIYVSPDYTFPVIITPSVDTAFDTTAKGASYYYQDYDTIWCVCRSSTSGLLGFRTNITYTGMDNVTSSLIPSDLQTNTNTSVIQYVEDPSYGATPIWNIRTTAGDSMSSYDLFISPYAVRFEPLGLSGALSTTYLASSKGTPSVSAYISSSQWVSNKGTTISASIVESSLSTLDNKIRLEYTIFSEKTMNLLFPVYWGESAAGEAFSPADIANSNIGTISGNTIEFTVTPGYTSLSFDWNILADNPVIQQAYLLSATTNYNLPAEQDSTRAALTLSYTF